MSNIRQKIPLESEQHYRNWWKLNCQNCPKSEYRKPGDGCPLELALCEASTALHGIEGKTLPSEVCCSLGGGYAAKEVCDRLGIKDSGLPWSCPEKELIITELRDERNA